MFGPYRITGVLGRGGMGLVHRAVDTTRADEREVALKRLSVVHADGGAPSRFRRESRTAASLHHPNLVQVYDYGEIDGELYLAMQLVEGTDLKRMLEQDGPLEPSRAIDLLAQIASGLDSAHQAGVVHRDVKPSNILIDGDTALLADFGIAKPMAADATSLTQTGGEIGTLDYMAPERLMRQGADGRSDVYSLACVLFQALTGKLPFPAEDTAGKLAAQLHDPPPAPSLFDHRIPSALDVVVATGMDKDPARRYPTAGELMTAAKAAASWQHSPTAQLPTTPDLDDDPGRQRIMRAIVSVAQGARRGRTAERLTRPMDECPYPGLRNFGPHDATSFYGREHAVTDVLVRLSRQSAQTGPLVVVGASGAGKSSLLHAGVLPALRAGADAAWPQLVLTPGANPLATLAARLAPIVRMNPDYLARRIAARPAEFGRLCRQGAHQNGGEHGRLVVVVDQLEELFTVGDPRQRDAFITAMASAWPALTVLAVRADYVEACIRAEQLRPSLANPYILGPLGVDDLRRVITEPARSAGLDIEDGLVDRLITDLGADRSAGYDPGALPRLAHALRETWNNRDGNTLTLKGYHDTGGIDKAVARTADGVYRQLPDQHKHLMRQAMLRMVTVLDTGGAARRRAQVRDLPAGLVHRLVAERLVTADADGVQLSHDSLLTAWPQLRQWIDEDRQNLLVRQHLDQTARAWQASGREAGELYRGARLAAAVEWARGRSDLSAVERDFLRESQRAQRRTTRRLRSLVAGLAVFLVLALIAGLVAVIAAGRAADEADLSRSRQLAAESLKTADYDPAAARRSALQAWQAGHTPEARGALISNSTYPIPVSVRSGVEDAVDVDVTADGRTAAVGGAHGAVTIIDIDTGRKVASEMDGHGETVIDVDFSPDGKRLATASKEDRGVRIWDVATGKLTATIRAGISVAWLPKGDEVAAVTSQKVPTVDKKVPLAVTAFDASSGRRTRALTKLALPKPPAGLPPGVKLPKPKIDPSLVDPAVDIAVDDDGARLAVGRVSGAVDLYRTSDGRLVKKIERHVRAGRTGEPNEARVAFSADRLASAGHADGGIDLADPSTGVLKGTLRDPDSRYVSNHVAFSADGGQVLIPGFGFKAGVARWNVGQRRVIDDLPLRPKRGDDVRGSAVVSVVAAKSGPTVGVQLDGTVLRWSNPGWREEPQSAVGAVAFSADGKKVSAVDSENVYTFDPGDATTATREPANKPFAVAYGRDGTRYVGTGDGKLVMSTKDSTRTITGGWKGVERSEIVVSPDGQLVAVLTARPAKADPSAEQRREVWDSRVQVFDTRTRERVRDVLLARTLAGGVNFSPDGKEFIVATNKASGSSSKSDNAIRRWRTSDFTELPAWRTSYLGMTAYTPDGSALLTGSDYRVEVRDPHTGKVRRSFGQHPSQVATMALSPDGKTLATSTLSEPMVRLWNVGDGKLLARLDGHKVSVNDMAFSPDGKLLATAGVDTDVGLWQVDTGQAVHRICTDLRAAGERNLDGLGC